MYRAALAAILSELRRQDRLVVVESISVESPKTRLAADLLRPFATSRTLVLVEQADDDLFLATRNLHWVDVLLASEADPVSLVGAERVVVTVEAVKVLEGRVL